MSKRKKTFPCGHKGLGQFCHSCAQKQADQAQKRQEKEDWQATFRQDPIDLRSFPKDVVVKARQILQGLANGQSYHLFRGKRLNHDRSIISIPVTRNYRLLYKDQGQGSVLIPIAVVSHEDYNVCKPGS